MNFSAKFERLVIEMTAMKKESLRAVNSINRICYFNFRHGEKLINTLFTFDTEKDLAMEPIVVKRRLRTKKAYTEGLMVQNSKSLFTV